MEKEIINGVNVGEIVKEYFTNTSGKNYYKRNIFSLTVFGKKSTRKNAKCVYKTIDFYVNCSKLDDWEIIELIEVFSKFKYNECYDIALFNNEVLISNLENLSFYQMTRAFVDLVQLINNATITQGIEGTLIKYEK